MKKIRILPKGYTAIMATLVIILFLLASLIRQMDPAIKLSNILSNYPVTETYGSLSIETEGDAVNYETKDIYVLWSIKAEELVLDATQEMHRSQYILRDTTFTKGNISSEYPRLLSNVFKEDILHQVMHQVLTPSYTKDLTLRNQNQLIRHLRPYLSHDKETITIQMTLSQAYDLLQNMVGVLFKDHQSTAFDQMIQEDILESFDTEFVMIAYIDEIKKMLDDYKDDSTIVIRFKSQAGKIHIEGDISLDYDSCDAREIIHLKIDHN